MSLVSYESSSGEESDYEGNEASIVQTTKTEENSTLARPNKTEIVKGYISDDEFIPHNDGKEKHCFLNLPKPRKELNFLDSKGSFSKPSFNTLPTPKSVDTPAEIKEQDDEFLHKTTSKEIIKNTNECSDLKKRHIKITIPPLKVFQDVENLTEKCKYIDKFSRSKTSGLLSMLPKAKSEQCFAKEASLPTISNSNINQIKPALFFIPDSVKHSRPSANTEDIEKSNISMKSFKSQINKVIIHDNIKVDNDDNDDGNILDDFFSLKSDQSLPEVSASEIDLLVAEKTARIMEASSKFLNRDESQNLAHGKDMEICELESSRKRYHEQQPLNSEALKALIGGSVKRRCQKSNIQIVELNSDQIMPSKDDWMRTALTSSTSYQPTGVLVDGEPAAGTRRKHQITYLAHKAKANEAELQAMWSANRQNRRATQSKYGF